MAKRWTIEAVREVFLKRGYELIDNEFKGVKEKCTIKDEEGFFYEVTFDGFNNSKNNPLKFHKGNRYTIKNIHRWLELNNPLFELLDTTYEKNNVKMNFFCKKHGHIESTLSNVLTGGGCKGCGSEKLSESKKNDLNLISEFYKGKGYILLDEYAGGNKLMRVIDKEGYIGVSKYFTFREGATPTIFGSCNPETINNIKKWLSRNMPNLTVISESYVDCNTKMEFSCEYHGRYISTWGNIYHSGCNCRKCASEKIGDIKREKYETVYNSFKEKGYELLTKEYINRYQELVAVDKDGYKISTTYGSLKICDGSNIFSARNPYTVENIRRWLINNGSDLCLISDSYETAHTKMIWYCNTHNLEFEATWNNIKKGEGCYQCGVDKRSGENAPNYNPNLSDEERALKRTFVGKDNYSNWRNSVFKRDDYRCVICGKRGKINAHHLDGWNWCIDKRLDIDNAVTLCEHHHKSFHKQYGYGHNTKEQYEEWIQQIKNDECNEAS